MDTYRLKLETEAATRLKERLTLDYGEDADLIRDMIEGETDLHRLIERCTEELAAVEGMKDGIEVAIAKMKARLDRYCRHAQGLRNAIQTAMEVAELPKLKTPAATLSIRKGTPSVRIIDDEVIPMAYMVQPPLQPDKKKIKAALEGGEPIPGADLSNGPDSLAVRFT